MLLTIDVVIPSFRLNPQTLLPILNLQRPADVITRFYLVSDNPGVVLHPSISQLIDNQNVFLIINKVNEGASVTRNNGLEAGSGEWILFLDDDVEVMPDLLITYANAAKEYPDETGFIGVVNMPTPPTYFAKAVDVNGSMGIFTIAKYKPAFAWGATANMMVSRKAVGEVRFAEIYLSGNPKTGGGEEVEFFLKIREQNNYKDYKSLPGAETTHPWWGNGKTDFARFYRYGRGNSFLAQRNKKYRTFDFLNTSETLLLAIIGLIITIPYYKVHIAILLFIAASLIIEYIVNIVRTYKKTAELNLITAWYVTILRNTYEFGTLFGNLSRFRIAGIGERFNYDGNTKLNYFRLNRFKIIKLILLAIAVGLIVEFI